ncbi:MAG: DUF1285 domain-containing protein [Deltaproteobacteria bacterium]|nr:DUF1285 domain-containing protein [Deltaproteobacteria bacterium]
MEKSVDDILIDGQGQWWYEGNRIVHPEVLSLFKRSLTFEAETGLFFIDYKGKRAPVKVAKTPFFVQDIVVEKGAAGELVRIALQLDDGTSETLVPESLSLDESGVLQVKVKDGRFAARCLAGAHFRLAELLEENLDGGFSLVLGGRSYIVVQKLKGEGGFSYE